MPRSYYDDNFGHWDIQDEGDVDFYHQVQSESVLKKCKGCGKRMKLRPEYAYCNSCANVIERGGEF